MNINRPAAGTPEHALWVAAIEIAINAPWKAGANVTKAQISWRDITCLRTALDEIGVNWQTAKRSLER